MPISNDTAPLAQFLAGQAVRAQEFLGSHPTVRGGQSGWLFRVWAPHAQAVAVMGDFNGWDAVSYTHLDVYKRQDYSSLTVNNGRATSATVSDGSLKLVITFDQVQ